MDYRYTNEDEVTVAITLTLHELDNMLNILEPVTQDLEHTMRYRATELHTNLADIRKKMIESAIESLQYRADRFDK
jgi:hypothetical protein